MERDARVGVGDQAPELLQLERCEASAGQRERGRNVWSMRSVPSTITSLA